ncbi:hypothetical protein [Saccharothrix sp. HUAS TT1]|uniref:hypothetical protein n=1 Tax=unclassified Saccharothrix TaxID=2593673 RepID=UPI00345C13EA
MTAVVAWVAGLAGHAAGDYLVQSGPDAIRKQDHHLPVDPDDPRHQADDRDPETRRRHGLVALARHAVTYGLTEAAFRSVTYRLVGIRVPWRAQLAALLLETGLHAVIDDGRLVRWIASLSDSEGFLDLDKYGVRAGRIFFDQATHTAAQIPVGALLTAHLTHQASTGRDPADGLR